MNKEEGHKKSLVHLQKAIQDIENFSNQNAEAPVPNIQNLEIKDDHLVVGAKSGIEKTIELTRYFITSIFNKSPSTEKKKSIQKKLLESIQFLKTHYRIIHKLKQGTPEEQEVADWALIAIQRYNTLIHKSQEQPQSLKERVANFVYEQSGLSLDPDLKRNTIEIPHIHIVKLESAEQPSIAKKISSLLPQMNSGNIALVPTQTEIELLRMKSLSMAKKYPKFPLSIKKTLSTMIWKTPVTVSSDHSESLVALEQTFEALPGEVIKVKGSFQRHADSPHPSVPIPDSFHLSTHAYQTGFPDPSQHTGATLVDQLIPAIPLRLDQLVKFKEIYHLKQQLAKELLPSGNYNEKAKRHLKLKFETFTKYRSELLELHHQLMLAIANASTKPTKQLVNTIQQFFSDHGHENSPLEVLSQYYLQLSDNYIITPFNKIYDYAIDHHPEELIHEEGRKKYQICFNVMESSLQTAFESHPDLFGEIIGKAAMAITLQQLSEKVGFPPPLLSNFEQKIQAWSFMQLHAFIRELHNEDYHESHAVFEAMTKQLKREIQLFKVESIESFSHPAIAIVQELELYYNAQYYRN